MVSVILPCLNEERGVTICVRKIKEVFKRNSINGEVIVVDNGSTDRSYEFAKENGAIVISQPVKGYGNAYRAGFKVARGEIIVMGDADNSYDFYDMPRLLVEIDKGYDFVMGSRFLGKMASGSMSQVRRNGNSLLRLFLRAHGLKFRETCTGFVAFRRSILGRLNLISDGMEFSSEMLIKVKNSGAKMKEIPIVYHNRIGKSKLNELKDGLRHISLISQEFLRS